MWGAKYGHDADENCFVYSCIIGVNCLCCVLIIWVLVLLFGFFFVPNRGYCLLVDPPMLTDADGKYTISLIAYFQEGCETEIPETGDYIAFEYYSNNSILANRKYTDLTEHFNNTETFYCIDPKMLGEGKLPLPKNKC